MSTVICCAWPKTLAFELLLTVDKNLVYQQNLTGRKIAIMALGKNRWSLIELALTRIADVVNTAKVGSYAMVEISFE